MKPETFDIPAYQFAILNIGSTLLDETEMITPEMVECTVNYTNKCGYTKSIPFEYVDGLTIGEVRNYTDIKGPIILMCYVGHEGFNRNGSYITGLQCVYLDNNYTSKNIEKPIDQAFEEVFEQHYMHQGTNPITKKVARCFFERYQDKSHEQTVDRIKRLEKTKK